MAEHDEHSSHDEKDGKHAHGGGGGHGGGGHGGGGAHEEHEGAPEWLISFADNVVLMMGFFVILLALNMGPKGSSAASDEESEAAKEAGQTAAALDWAIGVREAFNNPVSIDSKNPRERYLVMRLKERERMKAQSEDIGVTGDDQKTQSVRPSDFHRISTAISFEHGSAKLSDSGRRSLTELADQVRGDRLVVEIRGNASVAEASDHAKLMRLSFDRALAAARVLANQGLDWRQLRIVALADNDRLQNRAYSPDEHRLNQRVEVVVTNDLMPGY